MKNKTAGGGGGGAKQPRLEKKSAMIPPDEQRCCRNDGVRWRCTQFRMNLGVSKDDGDEGLDTKYCENHYNFFKEQQLKSRNHKNKRKKRISISEDEDDDFSSSEDDDSSSSGTETWDSNSLEWKKVANHSKEIQQATANDTISDIEGGSATVGTKRKKWKEQIR